MPKAKPLPASTRSMVVCCKIPNGLQLQLQTQQPRFLSNRDSSGAEKIEKVNFWVKSGRVYYVHGPAYPVAPPKGYPKQPMNEGGYALTPGIPVEFWNTWLEQNELADYVLSDMIYAEPSLEDAIARSRENEKTLSGMEPLSTDVDKNGMLTDPRVPRPLGHGMTKIAPDVPPANTSITQPA
jgi:hypothetical protein